MYFTNGNYQMGGNFKILKQGPIDDRMTVALYDDLSNVDLFDGYVYEGMLVSVVNDPEKNGVYILKDKETLTWGLVGTGDQDDGEFFTGSASIDVGGIKAGDAYDNTPINKLLDVLINPELFPTLTNPSMTLTSSVSGLTEIGSTVSVVLSSAFNRGSISPQYTSDSEFRSGLPIEYKYTGPGSYEESVVSTGLIDSHTVVDFKVPMGNSVFSCEISYDEGDQPKSSKDNDFDAPLVGGSVTKSITINGVYPIYSGISVSKLPLQVHGSDISVDAPVDMNVSGERFKIQYPVVWGTLSNIQQQNELSKDWDTQTMSEYSITDIDIGGVEYKQVEYIGSGIGARKLRLVF